MFLVNQKGIKSKIGFMVLHAFYWRLYVFPPFDYKIFFVRLTYKSSIFRWIMNRKLNRLGSQEGFRLKGQKIHIIKLISRKIPRDNIIV